jgi:hypothetical protein
MNKVPKIEIPLVKPYLLMALALLLFGGGGLFMLHRAESNDRGLIINGIIHLETGGADVFYAVLGLLSVGLAALTVLSLYRLVRRDAFRVVITRTAITFPNPRLLSSELEIKVRFEDVLAIRASAAEKADWLVFDTKSGPRTLNTKWLPADWPSSRLSTLVVERWRELVG